MINLLREAHEDPVNGYPTLFALIVNKGGDSDLYKASSPFPKIDDNRWFQLSEAKNKPKMVVSIMNEADISAELFLDMIHLLKVKDYDVCESILHKILIFDKKRACEWITKRDKRNFAGVEYNRCVSQFIIENVNSFDPVWIKDYLLSKRFIGSEAECQTLCKYLLSKPLEIKDKADLLQTLEIKDSQLWQQVANEFIGQGESWPECYNKSANINSETLVLWHQIIEHADDTTFVLQTLKKIPIPNDGKRDVIRSLVLVRLLKNWEKRKVDIEILKKLDLSKKPIPWETVLHEAQNGEQILKALNNVSLPLYSALFRTIKPKEPFYSTFWVKMMEIAFPHEKNEELLSALRTPLMADCLQMQPTICLPLFKRLATTTQGICFILDTLPKADQEIFCTMMHTSVALDDGGIIAAKVFDKYYHVDIFPKKFLNEVLKILAKKIIVNPQGDLETAGRIWKILRSEIYPERLPPQENLLKLIQQGYSDWVKDILNNAKKEDLQSLDSKVYCRLLSKTKDLEKRCLILEGCRVLSEKIQKQWEIIAQSDDLNPFDAVKLLNCAEQLAISANKVQQCALYVLSQSSTKVIAISEPVLKYLVEIIVRLDSTRATDLWIALMKSKLVNKIDLWKPALNILVRTLQMPSYHILSWIFQNSQLDSSQELLPLITQISRFPLEERIQNIIFTYIKQEALKQNEKAIDLYWEFNNDNNISIKDFEALKPTEERCKKTLDRYIERSKKEEFSLSQFDFFIFLWITYRSYQKEIDIHVIYEIIASYLLKAEESVKTDCIDKILAIFFVDLPCLADSKEMQNVCYQIANQRLGITEQTILLNHLSKNKLLVDIQWKLISKLASDTKEASYSVIIDALERLDNIDLLPTRIIFLCNTFPHYFLKLNDLLERVTDKHRKNYLKGLLISVACKRAENDINSPINIRKDLANKFITYLPYILYYINHNQNELKEWNYIKALSYYVHEDNPKLTINYYFYAFIANIFYAAKKSFFLENELFPQFLAFVDKYVNDIHLDFLLMTMLTKEILDKGNSEIALQVIHFITGKISKLNSNTTPITSLPAELGCGVLCSTAAIIIKHLPTHQSEITVCINALIAYGNNGSFPNEFILTECYVAILMITGDCNSLEPCLPNIQSDAIVTAIQNLCQSPHPENIRKAQNLLFQGTKNSLFLFNQKLRDATQIYIRTALNNCTFQTYQKVVPELFRHLCYVKQEDDVFDMTRENLQKQIKKMHEKSGHTVCSLSYSDEDYENYKTQRLELIHFIVYEIAKRFPFVIENLIGILNVSVFTILKDIYRSYPFHLEQLNQLLKEACDIELIQEPDKANSLSCRIAVLLCCHTYIPFEPWQSLFENPLTNRLLLDIQTARTYHLKLAGFKGDRNVLLQHKVGNEDMELTLTPDSYEKEISMKYQWMSITLSIFENADFDELTCNWLYLIKDEMIKCMFLSSESAMESISSNIIFIIQRVLKKIETIAEEHPPEFANRWLQNFIQGFISNVHIEKYKWLFGLIESYIQEIMTPKLLPSLSLLETFSSNISQVHQKRGCIEAYYRLLVRHCKEEEIINKAVMYSGQLLFKVGYTSHNFTTQEGSQFYLLSEKDFAKKFQVIYCNGLEKIVESFKSHKNAKQFAEEMTKFRGYTDVLFKQVEVQQLCIHPVIRYFYNNLEFFTNSDACWQMMQYVHFVQQHLQCDQPGSLDKFSDSNVLFLMLAMFCGPDAEDSNSNIYLRALAKVILPLMAMVDITSYENEKFIKMSMKFMILETITTEGGKRLTHAISNMAQMAQKRSMSFAEHKKLFIGSMQEQIDELVRFSSLRPELKSWYSTWIQAAIFAVSHAKEQTKDITERDMKKVGYK